MAVYVTRSLLLSLSLFALACGGSPGASSSGEEASQTTAGAVAVQDEGAPPVPESARVPLVAVELLEPGEGERTPLRFRSEVGHRETMRLEQAMTMKITLGETELPAAELPKMRMDFAMTTTHIGDDGAMRHEHEVTGLEVLGEGPLVARTQQLLEPMRDLKGWDVVDPRGRVVAAHFDIPANANPQMRKALEQTQDMLRQLMPPFPEEPVAVGARWKAVSSIRTAFAYEQESTYTLLEREGDRIVLQVETVQRAQPQPMESPQPGISMRLLQFEGQAQGRVSLTMDRLAPTSEVQGSASTKSEVTEGSATRTIDMAVDLRAAVEPLPAD